MDICEEYKRNNLDVVIHYDTSPESPREWDNLGTMICSHKRYTLGDEQFDADDYEGWDDLKKHLYEDGAGIVLPLSLYDHSGISMSIGEASGWDSGQVGFIYVSNEDLEKEYGVIGCDEIEKAQKVLEAEVKTYSQYLSGDVYGFSITNPRNGEEVDSCWGFFGIDDVKEEANSVADDYKHPREATFAKKAGELHG